MLHAAFSLILIGLAAVMAIGVPAMALHLEVVHQRDRALREELEALVAAERERADTVAA